MLSTGFLDKITAGILTGQLLLSGLLPALITLGYGALVAARFSSWRTETLWGKELTLQTLLAALGLLALTLLFDGCSPLLKRWLSGDAVWFPEFLRLRHLQRRQDLERRTFAALDASRAWTQESRGLEDALTAARAGSPAAPLSPLPASEAEARAITETARQISEGEEPDLQPVRDLVARLQALYLAAQASREELDRGLIALQARMASIRAALDGELGARQRELATQFPRQDRVRPTRFGNVMAAIDSYAYTRYGMDGVMLWPRIRQVAKPGDEWKALEGAQGRLDFAVAAVWIHVAVLVFALLALPPLFARDPLALIGLLLAGVFGAVVFYRTAVQNLTAYGLQVQAVFDLNRFALLDALRLPRPANAEEEYQTWAVVSASMLYPPLPDDRRALWYR
jgi:hypothetical protein